MTYKQKLAQLKAAVRRMHEADKAYGCGFYDDAAWRIAYEETARLAGVEPLT